MDNEMGDLIRGDARRLAAFAPMHLSETWRLVQERRSRQLSGIVGAATFGFWLVAALAVVLVAPPFISPVNFFAPSAAAACMALPFASGLQNLTLAAVQRYRDHRSLPSVLERA